MWIPAMYSIRIKAQVYDLTACINLAYAQLVSGEGTLRKRSNGLWECTMMVGYKDSVSPTTYESFLKGLRADGKSDSYLTKCRGMLYQIMHKAEANDLIRKNPVRFAEKMKAQRPVKRKEAFTQEEVQKLMEGLPQDRTGHTIRLMLATGMRTQEVLALEPQHIEPDGSCVHIRQAVNMVKGKPHIGPPKSAASVRDVPVPPNSRLWAWTWKPFRAW